MEAPATPPSRHGPALWRLLLPMGVVLAIGVAVFAALAASVWWLLRSDGGSAWLLARLPGVEITAPRGAVLGEHFEAERIKVSWAKGQQWVVIDHVVADGLTWQWRPAPGLWAGVQAQTLNARSVQVHSGPPTAGAVPRPTSLFLPLRIAVDAVNTDRLLIDDLAPMLNVSGRVTLGDDAGQRHHAEDVRLRWGRVQFLGRAEVRARAPFLSRAEASVEPAEPGDAAPWAATVSLNGPLEKLQLAATLKGTAANGHAAPAADVQAELALFERWPLASLKAQTEALDLAAFSSAWPQTRLDGQVAITSSGMKEPVGATVQLQNALPGRWNQQRLPLRSMRLTLSAHPEQRDSLQLSEFDITLGNSERAAGQWQGSGRWQGHTLALTSKLTGLQPQLLDSRAAAMKITGPLELNIDGLPSPLGGQATPPPWAVAFKADLDGGLDALPQTVQLLLEGSADAQHLELQKLRAQAGTALAEAHLEARQSPQGDWLLRSKGTLSDFDPVPWWPGEAGSAWRQGPHRLSADWQLDVRVPAAARRLPPLAMLPTLVGSGHLNLHDSKLAGVPLALDLKLDQDMRSTNATPSHLQGELRLAGNVLTVEAHGNPAGDGASDTWRAELQAQALAGLAPLVRLVPDAAAWAPRAGGASANLAGHGRWPALRAELQAKLSQLQAGELSIASGQAEGRIDLAGEQPLDLHAELNTLRLGSQRAQMMRADIKGTLAEHRLQLAAALPLAPPAIADTLFGVRSMTGTRAQLDGQGSWQAQADGGGRWQGLVNRLAVDAWDGRSLAGEVGGGWLDARDLRAEVHFDRSGNLTRLQADAGRLRLVDGISMHWDAVVVDLRGNEPHIALRATVDPFPVAPLLARLQPSMGWTGDLRLGARVEVRAAERFDADLTIERQDGDLRITDETGTQTLGLTDAKLTLAAHDGTWMVAQGLAGRSLGEMAAALTVKTSPTRRWPAPDAPIEGVVQARVANLGAWGAWVPPGWRLAGELRTSATIGGRFGAPEYSGEVVGSALGLRNLLQGVNVTQGDLRILLKGTSAQIEHFTLRGGEGQLTVTGGAEFGATPKAQVHLVAERFRVLGRIDRQLTGSGSADLAFNAEQVKLDGRVTIDEGLFDMSRSDAPALDDDVTVLRPEDRNERSSSDAPPRPKRNVLVALQVDLGENLKLRGRGLDTELGGRLNISTPNGRMAVNGTVNTEGGTYAAYGQKLEIERGVVSFTGPPENPRLDIFAKRPNIDMEVGVAITGTLQNPRVRLQSSPEMSDTDKLSWLVLGRAPDGLGRTDTALLQRAAVALLAGEGEAPTDRLLRSLGIDELSVRSSDTDVRETVISLGKQLSRRWYVGYERGVNATTGTWQLIYRIAQRFTLRAQSGAENSVDVIWVWRPGEPANPTPNPQPPKKN